MSREDFFYILSDKCNINLTEQQKAAVTHKDGPCIVLAVPGAGKTTVLLSRTAYLISEYKINPTNILAVTFSRAAALDMSVRFKQKFADLLKINVHFSTIHSFAFNVIRRHSKRIGQQFVVIEKGESLNSTDNNKVYKEKILKELYKKYNGDLADEDTMDTLLSCITYVKNKLLSSKEIKNMSIDIPINNFLDIYTEYDAIKRENNWIDYDDMLTLCLRYLKEDEELLSKYRNIYQYIQIDEAQDTSKAQWEIIKLLAYPKNNLYVVCDDDQSLYSFRGAEPRYVLDFGKDYPNTKKYFIEENFRSTKQIVAVANEIIKHNRIRYEKNMFTHNSEGENIQIIRVDNEQAQAKEVVSSIKYCGKPSDNAILYRVNLSAIPIIDMLDREHIPFRILGTNPYFFNHWVVEDIMAFIKLALDFTDVESFKRIYNKANIYIRKEIIEQLYNQEIKKDIFELLVGYYQIEPYKKENILRLKGQLKQIRNEKPEQAISSICNMGYMDYLNNITKRYDRDIGRPIGIIDLLKGIAENTKNIKEFLERVEYLRRILEEAKSNKYEEAVTLSTIHSAKGCEFKNVHIIDIIDEIIPGQRALEEYKEDNKEMLEEERRVYYVGLTRAIERLRLYIYPRSTVSSIFIKETEDAISKLEKLKFKPGIKVEHKTFGFGEVLNVDKEGRITVKFSRGIKLLSLQICLDKNVLKAI